MTKSASLGAACPNFRADLVAGQLKPLGIVVLGLGLLLTPLALPSLANPLSRQGTVVTQNRPKSRPNIPPGGRNKPQAGKGECPSRPLEMRALVPEVEASNSRKTSGGFSLSDRPTLWMYMPYQADDGLMAKMTLRTEEGELVPGSEGSVSLPTQPGVMGLSLPEGINLKPRTWYRWAVQVQCEPIKSVVVWVQYLPDAALAQAIVAKPPLERDRLYQAQDYWFDRVTNLAQVRLQKPQDPVLRERWEGLLKSEFEGVVGQPLIKD